MVANARTIAAGISNINVWSFSIKIFFIAGSSSHAIAEVLAATNNEKKTEFDEKRAKHIIKEISFENMSKQELESGFSENSERRSNLNRFFNQGKENKWEKLLPEKIKKSLEDNFKKEMIELNYLKSN